MQRFAIYVDWTLGPFGYLIQKSATFIPQSTYCIALGSIFASRLMYARFQKEVEERTHNDRTMSITESTLRLDGAIL